METKISRLKLSQEFNLEFSLSGLVRYINRATEAQNPETKRFIENFGLKSETFTIQDLFFLTGSQVFYHLKKDKSVGKKREKFSMFWLYGAIAPSAPAPSAPAPAPSVAAAKKAAAAAAKK